MTREEAIEYLKKADVTVYQEPKTKTAEALEMAIQALEERKTGRWIRDRYCSNCDWSNEDVYFTPNWTGKYCPECGAKMEGAEE